jgi:hypothetical protein
MLRKRLQVGVERNTTDHEPAVIICKTLYGLLKKGERPRLGLRESSEMILSLAREERVGRGDTSTTKTGLSPLGLPHWYRRRTSCANSITS